MTSRQTAAICATILLAALAHLAGGFAMKLYFQKRESNAAQTAAGPFSEARLDRTAELPRLSPFPGDGPDLVPLPLPLDDEEDDLPPLIGDGVGQPARQRSGRRFSPRELPASNDAAPITPQAMVSQQVISRLLEAELPDATDEERQVWREQLSGLSPNEIRNLLEMRRQFGSEIPQSTELPLPFRQPLRPSRGQASAPVVAPVPASAAGADE